jgi:hypothetical protein
MTSASAWFATNHSKRVSKSITGITTASDWPELAAKIIAQLSANSIPYTLTEDKLEWGAGKGQLAYSHRPALQAYQEGVLTVRSKDYGFLPDGLDNTVWGDKAGAKIVDNSMVKNYPNGMVVIFTPLN